MKKSTATISPFGTVQIETRGVNSDLLTNDVITFTTETLHNTNFRNFTEEHDRRIVIEYIEHFYGILMDNSLIEQFDIVFDKRNNNRADMAMGKFTIESVFKQKNCLNQTSVKLLIGHSK